MDGKNEGSLALAVAAGLAIASLLWRADLGVSWLVLVMTAVPIVWRTLDRRRPTALAIAWGFAAIWLAGCILWRASAWTAAIALPSSFAMLATLPILVHRRLGWADLGELPALTLAWIAGGPAAAGHARRALRPAGTRNHRRVLGGLLLGLPLSAITAALLSSNPEFRAASESLLANGSSVVSFLWWSVCAASLCLLGGLALDRVHPGVLACLRDPALLGHVTVATDTRDGDSPYRASTAKAAALRLPRSLAPVTWAVVLGQLVLVFGLFVAANLASSFGGHELVRAEGTRTYAEYLHDGFAEVTAATLLSVVVVMFGHRVVAAPTRARHARLLVALEIVLLALTAVTLGSCWQRMAIYLDAYGITHLRLFTIVWQVFAIGLLAITCARALVRSWRSHGAWLVAWPFVVAVAAASVNADLVIARANLQRLVDAPPTATTSGLDTAYLEGLSLDALPALADPHVPRDLAEHLLTIWLVRAHAGRPSDWRGARGLGVALGDDSLM